MKLQDIPQARENSTMSTTNCTSRSHQGPAATATTSMTSCSTSFRTFYAKTEQRNGITRAQNSK